MIIEIPSKGSVDSLSENDRNMRDMSTVFSGQDNEFDDNKLTMKINPTQDNELSSKKYIDDELDKNTILIFNQTLQKYLSVSVADDVCNLKNITNKNF